MSRSLRGRPLMRTAYPQDMAMLNTPGKRWGVLAIVVLGFALPMLLADDLLNLLALGLIAAVGAIGLNLVSGYAGQVSLGHAFFLGLGAYTGAVLGGTDGRGVIGYELPIFIWLPAAGLVAALAGALVAPLALRLKGLYLAIVTLGLVFLGVHAFSEIRDLTGGPGVGRNGPDLVILGLDINAGGEILGMLFSREQLRFYLGLLFLIVMAIIARNITRSGIGRSFAAVRDRDVAAAVVGVNLTRQKVLAFTLSSAYAGMAGALYYAVVGFFDPGTFGLLLSVQYIAMVLIGGVATISGSIMGALFISMLPRISGTLADIVPGFGTTERNSVLLTVFQLEQILYGLLIIGFLIFEPRGLYGIWIRIRNYWKGWPFSY